MIGITFTIIFLLFLASFYIVRKKKGPLVNAFKLILLGHIPLVIIKGIELFEVQKDLYFSFIDNTSQLLATLSIFLAIKKLKRVISEGARNDE